MVDMKLAMIRMMMNRVSRDWIASGTRAGRRSKARGRRRA